MDSQAHSLTLALQEPERTRQLRQAARCLKKIDPILEQAIDQTGVIEQVSRVSGTHYQALVQIIVGQQVSGAAARTIFGRLRGCFPGRIIKPEAVSRAEDELLRGAGISRPKIRAIRSLTNAVGNGALKLRSLHNLSNEEIAGRIVSVKGLGPWSAEMFLMFRLNRLDVFSPGDLGIRKAMNRLYAIEAGSPEGADISQRWAPYRTLVCLYLWKYLTVPADD